MNFSFFFLALKNCVSKYGSFRHVTPEATEEVLIGPPPLVGLQTA